VRRILQSALLHELKAPLNTATLILDLLGRSVADADLSDPAVRQQVRESVEALRREIRRLSEGMPGLLSLPEPGEEAPRPFDLGAVLEEALHLLRQQVLLRGAKLRRHLPDERVVVVGRPSELQHALLNVVLNAIECAPRGVQIDVRMSRANGTVLLRVEDDGPGIPGGWDARVFDARVTTKEGHDGLGLAVARSILHEHGGSLRLRPREGGGTVAEIELATSMRPAAPAPPSSAAAVQPPRGEDSA
jgi:signal transduction histidine kinase